MNLFDKFLRQKLGEKEFSPSEEHIASFTKMLDEKEDRKRFIWWPWMVGFGILLLAAFIVRDQLQAPDSMANSQFEIGIEEGTPENTIDNKKSITAGQVEENERLQSPSNSEKASIIQPEEMQSLSKKEIQRAQSDAIETSDSESTGLEAQSPLVPSILFQSNDEVEEENPSGERTKAEIMNRDIPKVQEIKNLSPSETSTHSGKSDVPRHNVAKEIVRLPAIVSSEIPTLDLSSNLTLEYSRSLSITSAAPVKVVKQTRLGIDMGWGLASVKNGAVKENGQRIRLGAFAERNLNSKFSIQLGMGFQYEGDALDFSKESTVSSQGFGLRSTVNTLDIKDLYEVYLNAGVQWRKGRHALSSLVQLGYVYGAKGDLVRYSDSTFEGVSEERISDVWLSAEGLNRLPLDLRLEYGFTVTQNVQLRFGLTVPVVSVMKNYVQEVTSTHVIDSRRSSLYPQLGIRYHLFKI